MKIKSRVREWMNEHEELVRLGAALGVVLGTVAMGVGLSRTFCMDAQDQVNRFKEKNEMLNNEISDLWRWINAQEEAGVEFKILDEAINIDGQNHHNNKITA